MGFYGNITNTARTQFQFDRVYPNRFEMEASMHTDGVYAGRYALIEYDTNATKENFVQIYIDKSKPMDVDGQIRYYGYSTPNFAYPIKKGVPVSDNQNLYGWSPAEGEIYWQYEDEGNLVKCFYIIKGFDKQDRAYFKRLDFSEGKIDNTSEASNYVINYNIDEEVYGMGRGYDSTVWQKVYVNAEEKYVMIAELNTVVPTFDLSVDAPTLNPLSPHFDLNSTDVYYKLHVQPSWGFRVAKAEKENESDEPIVWVKALHDTKTNKISYQYYDAENEEWIDYNQKELKSFPGAIYYNKKGFDYNIETKSDAIDKISIEPTGVSGNLYNTHDGTANQAPDKDIQELSIILPSIGNAVADMWNIVYGEGIGEKKIRNTDIGWNSIEGLRLSVGDNGYDYNIPAVETIAGCINSVHDLMGMVIKTLEENIDDADVNSIYWDDFTKKYYRKTKRYTFDGSNLSYYYEKVDVTPDNYIANTYYLDSEGKTTDKENIFNSSKTYYGRFLENNYRPLTNIVPYEQNVYYYASKDLSYRLEKQAEPQSMTYFDLIFMGPYQFKDKYNRNIFYYTEDNETTWKLETENSPVENRNYYVLEAEQINGKTPWESSRYYIIQGNEYIISTEWAPDLTYFKRTLQNINGLQQIVYDEIILFNPLEGYYQRTDNGYTLATGANDKTYYIITKKNKDNIPYTDRTLYVPHKYYYRDEDNYFLNTTEDYIEDTVYYIIGEKEVRFFEPNKYYVEKEGQKVLATIYEADENYYSLGEEIYVQGDSAKIYSPGALWNNQVDLVPHTVVLGQRNVDWAYEELTDFAKSYNTIHGLILRLNSLIEDKSIYTRDTATVRGSINKLNDIFAKFEALVPKYFLSVGHDGKIYSTNWTTAQNFIATNSAKNEEKTEESSEENRWIYFDLDEKDHKFIIKHSFNKVNNTETVSDKNSPEGKNGFNNSYGSDIKLYTPIVDNTGHIVGNNIETITLPYGYKTITTNGVLDSTGQLTATAGTIIADNAQDTLTINSGNKWLRIAANDENSDTITFAHEIHDMEEIIVDAKSLSEEDSKLVLFNIPEYDFDAAGHVIKETKTPYTMPFGYGKIVGDSGSTSASATYDTVTFESDDWLNIAVETDKVVYSHSSPVADKEGLIGDNTTFEVKTPEDSSEVSSLDFYTISYDARGHVREKIKESLIIETDGWIGVQSDKESSLKLYHEKANETDPREAINTKTDTYKFGDSFNIEQLTWDTNGHIYSNTVHSVTIPQPSLTKDDDKDTVSAVLSSIALTPETGAFVQYTKNIEDLILTSQSNATVKDVFSSIKTDISNIKTDISNIEADVKDTDDRIDSLIGLGEEETLPEEFDTINKIATSVNVLVDNIQNKYDDETKFSWQIRRENSETSTKENDDGSITETITTTVSYEQGDYTLQDILNDILIRLGRNDEGTSVKENTYFPEENPDENIE